MKRLIVLLIAVLVVFTACSNNIEISNNQQLSPTQSKHLFRNVDLGMTMEDVKNAEELNGCTLIDNTDSHLTNENAETIIESAKKDNVSIFIDNGDSGGVVNAEFNNFRGTIRYDFYNDRLSVIYFIFEDNTRDIYDNIKKLIFDGEKPTEEKNVIFLTDEVGDRCTWNLNNGVIIQLMLKSENNNIQLVFNGLNTIKND